MVKNNIIKVTVTGTKKEGFVISVFNHSKGNKERHDFKWDQWLSSEEAELLKKELNKKCK